MTNVLPHHSVQAIKKQPGRESRTLSNRCDRWSAAPPPSRFDEISLNTIMRQRTQHLALLVAHRWCLFLAPFEIKFVSPMFHGLQEIKAIKWAIFKMRSNVSKLAFLPNRRNNARKQHRLSRTSTWSENGVTNITLKYTYTGHPMRYVNHGRVQQPLSVSHLSPLRSYIYFLYPYEIVASERLTSQQSVKDTLYATTVQLTEIA